MIVGESGVGISVVAAVAAADIIRDGVPPQGAADKALKRIGVISGEIPDRAKLSLKSD